MARELDTYADDRPRWEQQPGETAKAYEAFRVYARLPYEHRKTDGSPGSRTLKDAADQLGKSVGLLKGWSSRWRWVERAEAFDVDQRRAELKAFQDAEQEAAVRLARRKMDFREKAWSLADLAEQRVREMLSFPVYEDEEEVIEDGPNGPSFVIVRTATKDWNPATAAGLVRALIQLAAVATDDGKGAFDRILDMIDPDTLSDEQLSALASGEDPIRVLLSRTSFEASGGSGDHEAG